jgi:hypothetical protein
MLRPAEVGVLIRLVAVLHERGRPVKEDVARLARLCCATPATFRQAVEALVDEGLIFRREGLLWSAEVEREIDFRSEKSSKSRSAAKKRWAKSEENQWSDDAGGMPDQSHSQSESERGKAKTPSPDIQTEEDSSQGSHSGDRGSGAEARSPSANEVSTARLDCLSAEHRRMLEQSLNQARRLSEADRTSIIAIRNKVLGGNPPNQEDMDRLTSIFRGLAADDGMEWADNHNQIGGMRA